MKHKFCICHPEQSEGSLNLFQMNLAYARDPSGLAFRMTEKAKLIMKINLLERSKERLKQAAKLLGLSAMFALPLTVYIMTLNPTISAGDSTEMITAAITLGIPHQPSFPINTILGHIFTKIPISTLAWRVNLMAAVFQTFTLITLFFVIYKITQKKVAAIAAVLFLAFSYNFWYYAVRAEVFALNDFIASLLLLTLITWHEKFIKEKTPLSLSGKHKDIEKAKERINKNSLLLIVIALLFGFGTQHHQTIILFLPAFLYLILATLPNMIKYFKTTNDYSLIIKSFVAFIIGLTPFLIIMWMAQRNPPDNWGEPKTFEPALKAFLRTDFGIISAYLQGSAGQYKESFINQLSFFFQSIWRDMNILGISLALIGTISLIKKKKKWLTFYLIAFLFTGPIFVLMAGFQLNSEFGRATVQKFNLLPEIILTLVIGYGIAFLLKLFENITQNQKNITNKIAKGIISLACISIFIYPLVTNYKIVDQKNNNLAYKYGEIILNSTEKNAIILVSGDIPGMVTKYFEFVEKKTDDRIILSPGQLHLEWITPQLKKRYKDLKLPPREGAKLITTSQIIEANWGKRPIYITPELSEYDPVVKEKYTLWPWGMLFKVQKKKDDIKLDRYRLLNDNMYNFLDIKLFQEFNKREPVYDAQIIHEIGRHFYNLGSVYEDVKLYDDAVREFKRASEIEPYFEADSYKRIGLIDGYKKEEKNKEEAIKYFSKYLEVAPLTEEYMAVKQAIYELSLPPEATLSAQTASQSAEASSSATTTKEVK